MGDEYLTSLIRLSAALVAGALIGFERTYHGRPAGFRTHILVSTSSSLLMLLTVFHEQVIPAQRPTWSESTGRAAPEAVTRRSRRRTCWAEDGAASPLT